MKINFSKCKLIPFNITFDLCLQYAPKVGCKLCSLPIAYLDFFLHNKSFLPTIKTFL
jgi:hypothetical protein